VKKSAIRSSLGGRGDYPITCRQLPTIFDLAPPLDDRRSPGNELQVAVDLTADPRQAWNILRALQNQMACAGSGAGA
jgi:hypothetical protein